MKVQLKQEDLKGGKTKVPVYPVTTAEQVMVDADTTLAEILNNESNKPLSNIVLIEVIDSDGSYYCDMNSMSVHSILNDSSNKNIVVYRLRLDMDIKYFIATHGERKLSGSPPRHYTYYNIHAISHNSGQKLIHQGTAIEITDDVLTYSNEGDMRSSAYAIPVGSNVRVDGPRTLDDFLVTPTLIDYLQALEYGDADTDLLLRLADGIYLQAHLEFEIQVGSPRRAKLDLLVSKNLESETNESVQRITLYGYSNGVYTYTAENDLPTILNDIRMEDSSLFEISDSVFSALKENQNIYYIAKYTPICRYWTRTETGFIPLTNDVIRVLFIENDKQIVCNYTYEELRYLIDNKFDIQFEEGLSGAVGSCTRDFATSEEGLFIKIKGTDTGDIITFEMYSSGITAYRYNAEYVPQN